MNSVVKSAPIAIRYQRKILSFDNIQLFINKNAVPPVIKRKKQVTAANEFMPVEILSTYWSDWNEPDMIKYKGTNGEIYIIQDDTLLRDVVKFMDKNKMRGLYPFIHIEGKHYWECYPVPSNEHLLEFLRAYNYNYDIYTGEGQLIREANSGKRKFDLKVQYL